MAFKLLLMQTKKLFVEQKHSQNKQTYRIFFHSRAAVNLKIHIR